MREENFMPSARSLAALLCVGMCTAVSACSTGKTGHREDLVFGDAIAFIPADTVFLLSVDYSRARGTTLWSMLKSSQSTIAREGELLAGCGLGESARVDSMLLAFTERRPEGKKVDFAAVLKGQFDGARVVACLRAQHERIGDDTSETTIGRHRMYALDAGTRMSLLDRHTCLVGNLSWVRQVLESLEHQPGRRTLGGNRNLSALVENANPNHALWWAGAIPQALLRRLGASGGGDLISTLRETHGWLEFREGFEARIVVAAADDAEAKHLAKAASNQLDGFVADRELQAAGLSEYLKSIRIGADGGNVTLEIKLDPRRTIGLAANLATLSAGHHAISRSD
jgi:hypothetical protein